MKTTGGSCSRVMKNQIPAKTMAAARTAIRSFGFKENPFFGLGRPPVGGGGKTGPGAFGPIGVGGFGISRGLAFSAGPSLSGWVDGFTPVGGTKGGARGPFGGGFISNGFDSGFKPFLAASRSLSMVRTKDWNLSGPVEGPGEGDGRFGLGGLRCVWGLGGKAGKEGFGIGGIGFETETFGSSFKTSSIPLEVSGWLGFSPPGFVSSGIDNIIQKPATQSKQGL